MNQAHETLQKIFKIGLSQNWSDCLPVFAALSNWQLTILSRILETRECPCKQYQTLLSKIRWIELMMKLLQEIATKPSKEKQELVTA